MYTVPFVSFALGAGIALLESNNILKKDKVNFSKNVFVSSVVIATGIKTISNFVDQSYSNLLLFIADTVTIPAVLSVYEKPSNPLLLGVFAAVTSGVMPIYMSTITGIWADMISFPQDEEGLKHQPVFNMTKLYTKTYFSFGKGVLAGTLNLGLQNRLVSNAVATGVTTYMSDESMSAIESYINFMLEMWGSLTYSTIDITTPLDEIVPSASVIFVVEGMDYFFRSVLLKDFLPDKSLEQSDIEYDLQEKYATSLVIFQQNNFCNYTDFKNYLEQVDVESNCTEYDNEDSLQAGEVACYNRSE